jgi:hypothetical protein
MKATIATLVLISLMITSATWANTDSTSTNLSAPERFTAKISDIKGDTLTFTILNPEKDKVILKVFSDRDVKVMQYNIGRKEAVRLSYLMENMRPCTYTAVVERNGKEILNKEVELNW